MASNIDSSNINTFYPIAGQDNDTQGFRTNFTNIVNNFSVAASEISALQNKVLASALINPTVPASLTSIGTTGNIAFDANYLYVCISTNNWAKYPSTTGSIAANNLVVSGNITTANVSVTNTLQLANLTQTQVAALTPVAGMMVYNYTYGNIQAYTSHLGRWGNITLT